MSEYRISLLLPTRGRREALKRSILSAVNTADNIDSFQILMGFDEDDTATVDYFTTELQPELDQLGVNYQAHVFAPMGYIRLNEYVNGLAQHADADWLVFWNDDAIMETQDWDSVINSYTGQFKLLAVHTHNDHPYSIFPIVPRAWLDIIGHLSLHSMNDAWLSQNAYCINIWERIDVNVLHDRADLTGNNLDATYKQRELLEGNPSNPKDFHHPLQTLLRMQECDQLNDYLGSIGVDNTFWLRVKEQTQDPWEILRKNDINNQMRQFSIKTNIRSI